MVPKRRIAILPISLSLLGQILGLPHGVQIDAAECHLSDNGIRLRLVGDGLPEEYLTDYAARIRTIGMSCDAAAKTELG